MECINVNDRLPENIDDLLIFCENNSQIGVEFMMYGKWRTNHDLVETMSNMDGIQTVRNLKVTHWMPLPELPKQ